MINTKAYKEVYEIIQCLPLEMQNQLPTELRKMIEYNMDKDYIFEMEDFDEINLLEDTEKILSVLYTDYFATQEEKQIILVKEKGLAYQKNLEKQDKYPVEFMKNKETKDTSSEEKSLVMRKEKIYIRIFNQIKKWFGI